MHYYGDELAAERLMYYLEDSLKILTSKYKAKTRIEFAIHVITGNVRKKGMTHLKYNTETWRCGRDEMNEYNILKHQTFVPSLVQLANSDGECTHCVTIVGDYIFDSNFDKALALSKNNLDICSSTAMNPSSVFVDCVSVTQFYVIR